MKNGRCLGSSRISIYLIRYECNIMIKEIYELIKNKGREERKHRSWNEAILISLHKKGYQIAILDIT